MFCEKLVLYKNRLETRETTSSFSHGNTNDDVNDDNHFLQTDDDNRVVEVVERARRSIVVVKRLRVSQ